MMVFAVKDVITPENILKQTVHEERHQSACDSIIKPNGDFQNFLWNHLAKSGNNAEGWTSGDFAPPVTPTQESKRRITSRKFQILYAILVSFWMISNADLTKLLRFGCFRHHFDVLKIEMQFKRILEKVLQNKPNQNRISNLVQYKQHLFIHLQGLNYRSRREKSHLPNTKPKLDQMLILASAFWIKNWAWFWKSTVSKIIKYHFQVSVGTCSPYSRIHGTCNVFD